jgi:hypothetical protein
MSEQPIDLLCHECGKTFSAFLLQMADQNEKVVCPACQANRNCDAPKTSKVNNFPA